MLVLFITLHLKYDALQEEHTPNMEIFSLQGDIKDINRYESYTTIDVEHITTDRLIAFENINISGTCFNGIIQQEGDEMIIKKIKTCH
jgi:hypothetical protein